MYRDGSGRTLVDILFSRRREVDGFPWLRGGEKVAHPARRNGGIGTLSAMLAKSVVVMLKGDVVGLAQVTDGGVQVRSLSQSGGPNHVCYWTNDCSAAYLPRANVTYHLGLLAMAEALQRKEEATDLLDAWDALLSEREAHDAIAETIAQPLATAADELYYWLRYGPLEPLATNDRLEGLELCDAADPPSITLGTALDAEMLTQRRKFRRFRKSGELEEEVEEPPTVAAPRLPKPVFRGWQLQELVDSISAAQNCLLIGPTGTGKSLCVLEAAERLPRPRRLFVIEGHSSLKEFDLLGGYVPDGDGGFTWRDGVVTQALREDGSVLFIDEANRMPARVLNVLLGVISRGAVVLTEHGSEEVLASDDFCVVMASNLGKGYHVESYDAALISRFPTVMEFHYLVARDEEQLLRERTGVDKEAAKIMVKVANETRRLKRTHELSGCVDLRGLIAWATKHLARKEEDLLEGLKTSAKITVMYGVCGTDNEGYIREDAMNVVLSLIEAHTAKK
jgi:MoxR-like ATPase